MFLPGKCTAGSNSAHRPPITGRILEILQATSGKASLVILDVFEVAAVRHEVFGMPILKHRLNEKRILVVPATVGYHGFLEIAYLLNALY